MSIIAHKKGETSVQSRQERRKALKDFYKLGEQEKQPEENLQEPEDEQLDIDKVLQDNSLKNLLELENNIHYKIASNKSLIKNIIYNNYFELITINEKLNEMIINEDLDEDSEEDFIVTEPLEGTTREKLEQLTVIINDKGDEDKEVHILDRVGRLRHNIKNIKDASDDVGLLEFVKDI